MLKDKVYIIGIGGGEASGLMPALHQIINEAEILFGGDRLLGLFPSATGQRITIRHNLAEAVRVIETNLGRKRMVVLASGDPNFYGIAKYMIGKLGKSTFEIVPSVSSMQLAFARIKESWDDAVFVSVHSRPIEDIVETVRSSHKIGIFTDNEHTPVAIAQVLLSHGIDGYRAYVCQNIGEGDEEVVEADLDRLPDMEFSPLNILILLRVQQVETKGDFRPRLLGIPDEEFHQRKPKAGLITKQEIRAVSLAKMCLDEGSVVWDIGAGSGAVSIEASFLARKGRIYAIEKNAADVTIIRKNVQKFNVHNVEVVQAFAPDGLVELPDPTAVFVGGSGGNMKEVLDVVHRRLKRGGHIVINIVALENLSAAVDALKARGFAVDVSLVNVARSADILELTRLEAMNPVFIVTGVQKTKKDG